MLKRLENISAIYANPTALWPLRPDCTAALVAGVDCAGLWAVALAQRSG